MDEEEKDPGSGMAEPAMPGAEVVILAPGDERSQKIGKAMGSPAAGEILHALEKGPATAGTLSSTLSMPLGTVKYHIENLLDAGLIEVRSTKYSVKGRQVKVYGLRNQLLIMAPRVPDLRSILLKYAALFCVLVLSTLGAYAALIASHATTGGLGGGEMVSSRADEGVKMLAVPAPQSLPQPIPADIALAFFFGGVLIIVILLLYEVSFWRKAR